MRTIGPRSVSSFLKVTLDIAFVVLAIVLIAAGIMALLSAISMANPEPFQHWRFPRGRPILASNPREAATLLIFCVFSLGLLGIVGLLRKIFITLIAGAPFQADNAKRLRIIGLILAGLWVSRFAVWAILMWGVQGPRRFLPPDIDLTGLFAVGVMFVLAEVFDEGVRMRKDLDLTI